MKIQSALAVILWSTVISAFAQDVSRPSPSYREKYRPQFHFTPPINWMNDPNGMFYFDGEYHLFYQYNPFGTKWGHMSWGHAVSSDLVHWEHLPVAIPEANKVMIFSGSAVVDWENTSGFGKDGKPPLVAIYTGHHTDKKRQDQRISYSIDRGRTWSNYSGNPVIDLRVGDFRDPKVIWHESTRQWVMAVSIPDERRIGFYGSPDLKHWRPLSEFGPAGSTEGIWECPDLFPLGEKWVLVVNVGSGAPAGGSGCQYFVGEFDGRSFTADERTHPVQRTGRTAPDGEHFEDFEKGYGAWEKTGDAFGDNPARGALDGQMAVDGFFGEGLTNSFGNGDAGTGTLTSPEFEIGADYINFLIGGGAHEGETCMNLIIDGEAVRSATGAEAESLIWRSWDVRALRGSKARLQIIDSETGGWGHINIDHIVFSPKPVEVAKSTALWADHGSDFYAAVSWSDIPKEDGRRIWIGWMSNWQYAQDVPTAPWRSAMTVPRELSLRETNGGYRMTQSPVKELEKLRRDHVRLTNIDVARGSVDLGSKGVSGSRLEIIAEFAVGEANEFGFKVRKGPSEETVVGYDAAKGELFIDRTKSGIVDFHEAFESRHAVQLQPESGKVRIHIFVDDSSVEVFGNGGLAVLTERIFPAPKSVGVETYSVGATTNIESLDAWWLQSIWPAE